MTLQEVEKHIRPTVFQSLKNANTPVSRTSVQIDLELREGFRHILASIAEADVARLVIDASRQEQNSRIAHNFFAESVNVTIRLQPHEADGAGVRLHPIEKTRMPLEEFIEKRKVAAHNLQITLYEDRAVTQGQGGQVFTGGAAANRGVVLELQASPDDLRIAASEPTEAQAGQAVGLAHRTEADTIFIGIASRG